MTAIDLLIDGGREARRVTSGFVSPLTKGEYLAYMRRLTRRGRWGPSDLEGSRPVRASWRRRPQGDAFRTDT